MQEDKEEPYHQHNDKYGGECSGTHSDDCEAPL
jgi:hypothetical protein